ncbi:MAG: histidinol-phosphate transaminase [Paracoccaceae bacterium]|nr:histidinol-phosphate transaminase [Paracoccaceae bacterium]MDE2917971.1 histidinol-phosphate transaminase [Paracoccaceae bacterium]
MSILNRARPDIIAMSGYSSARKLHAKKVGTVYLDANECPYEPLVGVDGYSRYPDQQPEELVQALCRLYDVSSRNLIVARGADEVIDVLIRTFCIAHVDNIIVCPPTFAMYEHSAKLHGIETRKVGLAEEFKVDVKGIVQASDENTKIVFICSPNNPTANLMDADGISGLCRQFANKALIVVDETYIEFSGCDSFVNKLEHFDNLVVVRTLSKSFAGAGLRCGAGIAHSGIIELLLKILPPYPIPAPVVQAAVQILEPGNLERLATKRQELLEIKKEYIGKLEGLDEVDEVLSSQANFVLLSVKNAQEFLEKCLKGNFIVRDQSKQPGLNNCVRVAIGSRDQMDRLLGVLQGNVSSSTVSDRIASVTRKTNETSILVRIDLDSTSPVLIDTGLPFLDHMIEQIARHGGFALELECQGDMDVEAHHSVEDCAIALGDALKKALGDKRGIGRYGSCELILPMDEAQAQVALDIGGRSYLRFEGDFPDAYVGNKDNPLPVDMVEHVFRSLAENLQATIHISVSGENTHHMVETCFKGLGRALRQAIHRQGQDLPSTKGVL